jgi:transposase
MARRAELFVRELSDEEAALLLKLARHSRNPIVQHRAMLLFASFQGQSVSQIALMHRASATHVAELIRAFNAEGFAALDPRRGEGRPRRIDPDQRAEIVKVALARPVDRGEPFTNWSLTKLQAHLIARGVVPTINRSQLWRILHERGIRFTHHKTWKASPDPDFEAKKNRVLDLHAHPPADAHVLYLDEFGALNLQPRLGHGWHRSSHPVCFRATYKRTAGARHLVAAYDPASGKIYGHIGPPRPGAGCVSCSARSGLALSSTSSSCSTTSARTRDVSCASGPRLTTASCLPTHLLELTQPRRVPIPGAPAVRPKMAPTTPAMRSKIEPSTPTCAGTTRTLVPPSLGPSTPKSIIRSPTLRHEALVAWMSSATFGRATVVVGNDEAWESEGRDRKTVTLPNRQNEPVERVAAATTGRSWSLTPAARWTCPGRRDGRRHLRLATGPRVRQRARQRAAGSCRARRPAARDAGPPRRRLPGLRHHTRAQRGVGVPGGREPR